MIPPTINDYRLIQKVLPVRNTSADRPKKSISDRGDKDTDLSYANTTQTASRPPASPDLYKKDSCKSKDRSNNFILF